MNSYKTNQKQILTDFLHKNPDREFTVSAIAAALECEDKKIGVATIYRHLNRLESQGKVRNFTDEKTKKSCWQYVNGSADCVRHYHIKCEECGKIVHLDCDFFSKIDAHILEDHGFCIDRSRTVFYGTCRNCSQKNNCKEIK